MFRPFQEFATPRHIIQEQGLEEDINPLTERLPTIPNLGVDHHFHTGSDYFLVFPQVLDIVSEALIATYPKAKVISTITVSLPKVEENEDEFDEVEQLYTGSFHPLMIEPKVISIYQITVNDKLINFLTIPKLDKIVYNLLASTILQDFKVDKLICVATSDLFGEQVAILKSENYPVFQEQSLINQVKDLQPPHFVTGPIGSLMSQSNILHHKCLSLVVHAEGAFHLDLERFQPEALTVMAKVLSDYLRLDGGFVKNLTKKLQFHGHSSSGLYL